MIKYLVPEKTCLVIPCYNEEQRLDLKKFHEQDPNLYFLFVNDGSSDGTASFIQKNLPPNSYFLNLPKNQGKAGAVRLGVLHLAQLPIFKELQWFGYWDADLATPLHEVGRFFWYAQGDRELSGVQGILGSRIYKLGSKIVRSAKRHYFGRIFATLAHWLVGIETYDSQCGAKLFRKALIPIAFKSPFISRWIFDVEILVRLEKHTLIECPVSEWVDVKGSKVRVFAEFPIVMRDLLRIRKFKKSRILNSDF